MQSQCCLLLCPTTAYLYLSHLVMVTLKEKWQVLSKITGICGKVTKKKRSEFKQKSQKSCSQKSQKLFWVTFWDEEHLQLYISWAPFRCCIYDSRCNLSSWEHWGGLSRILSVAALSWRLGYVSHPRNTQSLISIASGLSRSDISELVSFLVSSISWKKSKKHYIWGRWKDMLDQTASTDSLYCFV